MLVDSGTNDNFLDVKLAGLLVEQLKSPITANALDGRFLAGVTHRTTWVLLVLSGNHREYIQFNLIPSPSTPLVLGHAWLNLPLFISTRRWILLCGEEGWYASSLYRLSRFEQYNHKEQLPLISSAFEPLHGATIFPKLDLRNAYHLVRIREDDE